MAIIGFALIAIVFGTMALIVFRSAFGALFAVTGGFVLLLVLITIPVYRMQCQDSIAKYYAMKGTIAKARAKGAVTEIERAAMQTEIINTNTYLASVKYWNSTQFDPWWVDELAELPPLE